MPPCCLIVSLSCSSACRASQNRPENLRFRIHPTSKRRKGSGGGLFVSSCFCPFSDILFFSFLVSPPPFPSLLSSSLLFSSRLFSSLFFPPRFFSSLLSSSLLFSSLLFPSLLCSYITSSPLFSPIFLFSSLLFDIEGMRNLKISGRLCDAWHAEERDNETMRQQGGNNEMTTTIGKALRPTPPT